MKKTLILAISFLAILGMSSGVYAETNTAGGSLTINGDNSPGPNLTFAASPGVLINVATTDVAYGIVAGNPKAGENGIAYNVHSGSGAVFLLAEDMSAEGYAVDAAVAGDETANFASK